MLEPMTSREFSTQQKNKINQYKTKHKHNKQGFLYGSEFPVPTLPLSVLAMSTILSLCRILFEGKKISYKPVFVQAIQTNAKIQ